MGKAGSKIIDMVGRRIERLSVLSLVGTKSGAALWLCQCDCGKQVTYHGGHLRKGVVKSCGCY